MDAYHKKKRKRELEKNKKRREESRKAAAIMRDPMKMENEIRRLEGLRAKGDLDQGKLESAYNSL